MPARTPLRVAILALPEATASVVYGMLDLFASAGRDWGFIVDGRPGEPAFAPRIVARTLEPLRVVNDGFVAPHATFAELRDAELVCVPELFVPPGEPLAGRFTDEISFVRDAYARGATLATACSGAMLLAEAGLLDGCEATTHWAYCDVLRRDYPRVTVKAHSALVASGEGQRLVMAGGGTSWLDVALYLIARFAGVDAAMQTAKLNLIDWHDVGQQPFARLASARQNADAVVADAQAWFAEHFREPGPVARAVELSGLAERSFKRRFKQATGMAPLEYVHALRIEHAKELLEASSQPIELVAAAVGYEDAGFFARLFRRNVRLSPAQYRKRFGGLRSKLDSAS
ncbi:MAG: helix-turn-helix domain-containing protein [Planctomycetes bacterium]|nr:helix-turn-helix domain-containing protein [Planctomycetota bacterium]